MKEAQTSRWFRSSDNNGRALILTSDLKTTNVKMRLLAGPFGVTETYTATVEPEIHQGPTEKMRARRALRHRLRSTAFLLPAWFAPSSSLRAAFHRARGVHIEKDVEIGYMVILDNLFPDFVTIGSGATVSARATVLAHDESHRYTGRGREVVEPTRIGRRSFIGVNAVILPGVTVGERAIVGAGSIVTDSVPNGATVVGVPARAISGKDK